MAKNGPIIILEDDQEDIEILEQAFAKMEVRNQRHYFNDGQQILDYIFSTEEQPFLIISNVKTSGVDGFELRERIQGNEYLRKKGVPFVYLSNDARKEVVEKAFELTVQGFFEKQNTVPGVERQLERILNYWDTSEHPNS